jgi:hypothetical protein
MSTFIAKEDILSQDFQEKKTLKYLDLDLKDTFLSFLKSKNELKHGLGNMKYLIRVCFFVKIQL